MDLVRSVAVSRMDDQISSNLSTSLRRSLSLLLLLLSLLFLFLDDIVLRQGSRKGMNGKAEERQLPADRGLSKMKRGNFLALSHFPQWLRGSPSWERVLETLILIPQRPFPLNTKNIIQPQPSRNRPMKIFLLLWIHRKPPIELRPILL